MIKTKNTKEMRTKSMRCSLAIAVRYAVRTLGYRVTEQQLIDFWVCSSVVWVMIAGMNDSVLFFLAAGANLVAAVMNNKSDDEDNE